MTHGSASGESVFRRQSSALDRGEIPMWGIQFPLVIRRVDINHNYVVFYKHREGFRAVKDYSPIFNLVEIV